MRLTYFLLPLCLVLAGCQLETFGKNGRAIESDVHLYWNTPTFRTNGESIDITEIGGYVLRYRATDSRIFTSILINAGTNQFFIPKLAEADKFRFEVAAFDTNGVYSSFVEAQSNHN
jgi:hypothetical protein